MNVLILLTSGEIGGAERSLTRMVLANTAEDIVYYLATIGGEGAWMDWASSEFSQVANLGNTARPRLIGMLRAFMSVARHLRAKKIDLVYMVGLKSSILVRLLKPLFPNVMMINAIRASLSSGTPEGKNYRITERFLKAFTAHYISNSKAGREAVLGFGVPTDKVSVIYNGIDLAEQPINPIYDRPMEVCLIANIAERKGHEPFLDIIAIVRRAVPNVFFRFIGRDDMDGALHQLVEKRGLKNCISFEGFQHQPSDYLRCARVSVLPAILPEGAPTSILEAFACGTPVICYDTGGSSELVEHGIDGYLIFSGDKASFASCLIELLKNPDKTQEMGQAGLDKVRRSLTIEACAQNHAMMWHRLRSREDR
jgi:glycosyltransferase involved in cell wall biosynthesis